MLGVRIPPGLPYLASLLSGGGAFCASAFVGAVLQKLLDEKKRKAMSEAESRGSFVDTFILLLALAVMVAGVAAFYMLAPEGNVETGAITENKAIRALIVLAGLGIGCLLAVQSAKGRALWEFARGSRKELRKVVWPTRQETVQTTLMVMIVVVIIAIMLFGLDQLVGWLFDVVVRA